MKEHPEDSPGEKAHAADSEDLSDEFIEAALGAFRHGDVEGLRALGTQRATGEPTPDPNPSKAPIPVPRRFPLDSAHVAYGKATRKALAESFGEDVTAPEKLLLDLVSAEVPIHCSLVEAEAQLTARLEALLLHDDIKSVATLAKALRHVSVVAHAIGRRVETVLGTAVALRAQRRLVELHRGGGGR